MADRHRMRWLCLLGVVGACGDTPAGDEMRSPACMDQDAQMRIFADRNWGAPSQVVVLDNPQCGRTPYVGGVAPLDLDAVWRIGSNTKTFVSAAILSLAKDGLLALDDPMSRFVPNVANTDGITVRMLLAHRSGLYNYTDDPAIYQARDRGHTPRELVDLAATHPPYFAPDVSWHYSNTNYIILGMILEAATGQSVASVLRDRTIAPAGLMHTYLDGDEQLTEERAQGYGVDYTDVTYAWAPSNLWTAGSIVAPPLELAAWIATLYGTDTIIDADQRTTLSANPTEVPGAPSYGLGVQIRYVRGAGIGYGHNGSVDGFHCETVYFPDVQTGIVVMLDRDGADPIAVLDEALAMLFP